MKKFQVLGSGCTKCHKTADMIRTVASDLNTDVSIENESNPQVIMQFGVMSTPAVVLDGKLVHSGSIPHRADIESWLAAS